MCPVKNGGITNRLVFIVNLLVHLAEKILLLNPINARGYDPRNIFKKALEKAYKNPVESHGIAAIIKIAIPKATK